MRVVTYNLHACEGMDGKRSVSRIARTVQGLKPDIVCLQEVHQRLPWSGFGDHLGGLTRMLGMRSVFQCNYRLGIGRYGNAVMTRGRIVSSSGIHLTNYRERATILRLPERRGIQQVVVKLTGIELTVLNTHWSLHPDDRLEIAAELVKVARGITGTAILAGDFNAESVSAEMALVGAESGLIDSGVHNSIPTFPADAPVERIDFIWHSRDLVCSELRVVDTIASDHRPVLAVFETA